MIKYLLLPGEVRSISDGHYHQITAHQLCRLYGVQLSECVVCPESFPLAQDEVAFMNRHKNLIKLFPRANGNYTLPS